MCKYLLWGILLKLLYNLWILERLACLIQQMAHSVPFHPSRRKSSWHAAPDRQHLCRLHFCGRLARPINAASLMGLALRPLHGFFDKAFANEDMGKRENAGLKNGPKVNDQVTINGEKKRRGGSMTPGGRNLERLPLPVVLGMLMSCCAQYVPLHNAHPAVLCESPFDVGRI